MKKNSEPLTFSALNFTFASIGALVICDPAGLIRVLSTTDRLPLWLLFFVLFSLCTAVLPYALYTLGLSGVRPDVASILAFSEPLTAAVFGITVLRQPFDYTQGIGITLVIAAIVILNLRKE